jgi:hypothetical protein
MERALVLLQQTAFEFSVKACGHREEKIPPRPGRGLWPTA